jgi:hypothetical protein
LVKFNANLYSSFLCLIFNGCSNTSIKAAPSDRAANGTNANADYPDELNKNFENINIVSILE